MKGIFEEVAKENGVTVEEVLKEMELAIGAAFENPTPAALAIPRKGKVPTPEEFIKYISQQLKND